MLRGVRKIKFEERVSELLFQTVARIFRKDVSMLSRDTRFIEDLHAKSINIVEIIAELQGELEIEISMAKLRRKQTIGEVIDFVVSLK